MVCAIKGKFKEAADVVSIFCVCECREDRHFLWLVLTLKQLAVFKYRVGLYFRYFLQHYNFFSHKNEKKVTGKDMISKKKLIFEGKENRAAKIAICLSYFVKLMWY